MHLLEVGLILEGLAPGAVTVAFGGLHGAALAGPGAALRRPLQPCGLLVVVTLERPRHFVTAACVGAVGGGSGAGIGPSVLVELGATHLWFLSMSLFHSKKLVDQFISVVSGDNRFNRRCKYGCRT